MFLKVFSFYTCYVCGRFYETGYEKCDTRDYLLLRS